MSDRTPPLKGDFGPLLINVKEVSTILGISQRSVWRLLIDGKIIEPIRLGGNVRWRKDELLGWIANGCPTRDPLKRSR